MTEYLRATVRARVMKYIKRLGNEAEYDQALREIARYFEIQPEQDSSDGLRFDALAAAIESYEAKHHRVDAAEQARKP